MRRPRLALFGCSVRLAGPALLGLACVLGGCAAPRGSGTHVVSLAGASVPVELVESWLDRAREPRFVTQRVQFFLSRHGFERLRDGACTLACTDRPISDAERRDFPTPPIGRRVGFYGYALYVHPSNRVDSIFLGDIRNVFSRKVTNWKELGGDDAPIRLVGPRKSTRGGGVLAQEAGIFINDAPWEVCQTNAQIVAAVAADATALGFAEVGFDRDARYLGIHLRRSGPPSFPSLEEIEACRYPLAQVIHVYCNDPPSPAAAAAIEYLSSDGARRLMESAGVWPIPQERGMAHGGP
ncbi:MAG: substrate-binding domain-containing protein [Phycisphaerae bacterium]|nr:substrate-binding domain-containing protein [Phycisphaerae bacterium]MCZ2399061.1 substrate-binding domain-containing protein [Phycisphaerae bacterium]NUQ49096.1 substrate-binding domain-containing protein [Phycisphaerae bacterium]